MSERDRTDAEAGADEGLMPEEDPLPPEAVEEARRWKDVPMQNPEDSTGIDV